MSKIEVNEIDAQSGTTITVGSACKSVAVPGNVVKTNAVQASDAGNIISQSGTTITIGASGDTVSLASGASQSGFGRSGSVDWQTGSLKTSTFTAASGEGYFVNASGAITMNLPAGTAGAIVAVSDYARNFATHNLTISPNGSQKIGGNANDATLNVNGQASTFVYVDDTKGWVNVQNAEDTETGTAFISATGGTISTVCTNFKVHTFTGPGTFCVSQAATCSANNQVSYIVVAGGGGGGGNVAGGGGAGGFREDKSPVTPYTASPLDGAGDISVTATAFPITVGAGGTGGAPGSNHGGKGGNSIFSTITSTGGGGGGGDGCSGQPGGSGGGRLRNSIGTGNTPPVSPSQGNPGGEGSACGAHAAGGGGGATAAGVTGTPSPTKGGCGGAGATTSINGTSTSFSGGGGGSATVNPGQSSTGGNGGLGGGGGASMQGTNPGGSNGGAGFNNGADGTPGPGNDGGAGGANSGGGGGGSAHPTPGNCGGAGGSGIVIIRYKYQ